MSISFVAEIHDLIGCTLPSQIEKSKILVSIESQAMFVLDGFLGVAHTVLIGPDLDLFFDVFKLGLILHIKGDVHQNCRGGSFWLLRYFCQRFLAAAALSLRWVVGLT